MQQQEGRDISKYETVKLVIPEGRLFPVSFWAPSLPELEVGRPFEL